MAYKFLPYHSRSQKFQVYLGQSQGVGQLFFPRLWGRILWLFQHLELYSMHFSELQVPSYIFKSSSMTFPPFSLLCVGKCHSILLLKVIVCLGPWLQPSRPHSELGQVGQCAICTRLHLRATQKQALGYQGCGIAA